MNNKHRIYALILMLGASILIYRTVTMIVQGALGVLVLWVGALLIAELIIDLSCFLTALVWAITKEPQRSNLPLRLGAAAAILHAFRVLIFVLGRTPFFYNFDVRLEQQAAHAGRWSWLDVWFASILSILGLLGVIIIWRIRTRNRQTKN